MRLPAGSWVSKLARGAVAAAAFGAALPVAAQFNMVPLPTLEAPPGASAAETAGEYRHDAARHLYAAYASRIFKGKLPPLLFGVMITETQLGPSGEVLDVKVLRRPAAEEVGPWAVQMIRRAAPFPAPAKLGATRVQEIWLVHKSGQFQLDALTEGQH